MFHNPKPRFFQPLIPGFDSNFSIPKSFYKYLGGEKDGKNLVILREKRGRRWGVKVDNDDKMQFKEGWKKFCDENDLHVGDFLVFRHAGNWVFDVFIFDPTYCERHLPHFRDVSYSSNYSTQGSQQQKVNFKPRGEHTYCHVKPYSLKSCLLYLPIKFARENGLNKRADIMMVDVKGRAWPMNIRLSHGRYPYIGSWASFQTSQNLKAGGPIILEVVKSGKKPVLKLHVL